MRDYDNLDFFGDFDDASDRLFPDFYYEWDEALNQNRSPRFLEADEINQILEIYSQEYEVEKTKSTIQYALVFHPENEELIQDILSYLFDLKQWNDLYSFSEKYKNIKDEVWPKAYKLAALLHLGMEEDAFVLFQILKKKYRESKNKLSIIYQSLSEGLNDIDLYDASLKVTDEAISILGPSSDLFWIQMRSHISLKNNETALSLAEKIEKLSPLSKENWYDLGNVYSELNEREKAIEAFEFAKSLGYDDLEFYITLIGAYEKNENMFKALEAAKEYLQIEPENNIVSFIAIELAAEMSMWEEALDIVNEILKINALESLYIQKSRILLEMGEYKKAISAIEEGLKNTKDNKDSLKKELKKLKEQFPNI